MTKARLKVTEEDFRSLKWEHEVLEQRFEKVKISSCFTIEQLDIPKIEGEKMLIKVEQWSENL